MTSKTAVFGVVLLVVTGGLAGAFALGVNPIDIISSPTSNGSVGGDTGGTSDTGDTASDGSSTGDTGSSSETDNSTADSGSDTPSFSFVVQNIEECGTTCRDVTVAATNQMDDTATNVEVETVISADGDQLWTGTESFTEVDAGESKTRTKRVKLGYLEAAKVQNNDGYITVTTTITWDGGEQTFSERRKVA
ncbi:hypothetical protein SAMN04487949_0511 [Halogranum gelatinilyticum]|uniref:Uncharacterized protein n=1 Tax=Halogranum gelatinilyticum TaxID=660521 RepID=A0A1G9PS86_9EURY|nr:hypothetical protein [Halogranum gelatinilyticum]SDM01662.1 hypothetical protein SAMN04487949_0511 [Halogranum gelatinilyticum]